MRKFLKPLSAAVTAVGLLWAAPHAAAFCGFYVAKADANLFNEASKVVMARDGNRTVITMVNDYEGDLTEFAMVIPTPVVLQESQINIGKKSTVDHLDAYTAPRLVEYHDPDPCRQIEYLERKLQSTAAPAPMAMVMEDSAADLGVTIEAEYTIGGIRYRHPFGDPIGWPANMARSRGLQSPAQSPFSPRQLHRAGYEVLRREGEPRSPGKTWRGISPSNPTRVRA